MADLTRDELIDLRAHHVRIRDMYAGSDFAKTQDRAIDVIDMAIRALDMEADLALAAGELRVPMPAPGTDMARLLSANVLMRREIADTRARAIHAEEVLEATRAEAAGFVSSLDDQAADARLGATVLRDCGQRGVCRTPPGCARHWEERNRELVRENEVLRSNSDHISSENASLARQVESMAMRIESLAEELAKPEDVRLREVLDALDGRAVIFDGLGARVGHLLDEMDEWIGRAGEAERLAEERLAHANQLQADIEAEMQGRLALRKRLGAREDETMGAFLERLAAMAGVVPADVHEHGWQWRPTATDTAFAPPFGTIRQCRCCGCLVAGGPTACVRCAKAGE